MNRKYIEKLEFDKVLELLCDICVTSMGKNLAKNLYPENNKDIVLSLLKETSEATGLIFKFGIPPFVEITDFTYIEKILNSNSSLNAKNLLEVARNFKISR